MPEKKLNFCLMTSSNYLAKALVMYDSLLETCGDEFSLYYYAFDDITFDTLKKLNYKHIVPVHREEFEDQKLLKIKSERSPAEYFFTCTPQIIDYSIEKFYLDQIIYLDADLYFYKNPRIILEELNCGDVLITKHNYYPPVSNHPSGIYCVQFVPFKNTENGRKILNFWKEKCLEWCYLRAEEGKWADQGYLNDWTERFEGVRIMNNRGGGVASWNIEGYSFNNEGEIKVKFIEDNSENPLIFYHFHGIKFYLNDKIKIDIKDKSIFNLIYKPYIKKLFEKEKELNIACKNNIESIGYLEWKKSFWRTKLSEVYNTFLPSGDLIISNIRKGR